jgi:hypothetical protein
MGLIPCDEAAHIHTNSLLNLEVWESAILGRQEAHNSEIWESALANLSLMVTTTSEGLEFSLPNQEISPKQTLTNSSPVAIFGRFC